MKRTLPLLCTLILGMNFAYGETTTPISSSLQTQEYQSALKVFKAKDYEKALALFDKLVEKYPEDELVNFYYGRSAFELKNYEFAFSAYDRILISNPANQRVRLEYARTLFMMKSYKEAKTEFEAVLASPIPENVRKNVEKFLELVNSKEKGYILNKIAIFGLGWDNNVGTDSEYTTGTNTEKRGIHFKTILVGNLIVPFKSNEKISWESLGIGYIQEQLKYHENDIWLLSTATGIAYTNKNYKNLTSVTYDRISVESDSNMYYYGLSNSLKYKFDKDTLTFNLKYKKKKKFKKEESNQNTNIKEIVLGYNIPFEAQKLSLDLTTTYTKERQEHGAQLSDTDKNTRKYKVALKKDFQNDLSATFSFQKEYGRYKNLFINNITFATDVKRDDTIDNFTLKIDKKIDKEKMVSIEISKIKADSTYDALYSYDKKAVNVNYTVIF